MPTVMNMKVDGVALEDVVGKAYRRGRGVTAAERLDGSSLNVGSREHLVGFTLQRDSLAKVKHVLGLNCYVDFSADYSTGERVAGATVLVKSVDHLNSGDVEYVLAVGPGEAVLDAPAPG